jgi:hypothetical protein
MFLARCRRDQRLDGIADPGAAPASGTVPASPAGWLLTWPGAICMRVTVTTSVAGSRPVSFEACAVVLIRIRWQLELRAPRGFGWGWRFRHARYQRSMIRYQVSSPVTAHGTTISQLARAMFSHTRRSVLMVAVWRGHRRL